MFAALLKLPFSGFGFDLLVFGRLIRASTPARIAATWGASIPMCPVSRRLSYMQHMPFTAAIIDEVA